MDKASIQDSFIGVVLEDRYEILALVGHGGMGVVYKARHAALERIVAVKMLKPQFTMDDLAVQRFKQEAKLASRLNHPHVVALHDFGVTAGGQPFLVMDFLSGVSLAEVIKNEGQVGAERCIRIFTQVCDALEHAHRNGIIHRDLKPGNIMLVDHEGQRDFVKVVDFGVAKIMRGDESQQLTRSGQLFGSPVYMSPEQCLAEQLDHRSDIYSLGIVMYETLTGQVPLMGKDIIQTIMLHKTEMPAPFSQVRPDLYIPERLESVVFNALQKEPVHRHQSMAELKEDLELAVPRPARSALRTGTPPARSLAAEAQAPAAGVDLKPILVGGAVVLVVAVVGAFFAFTGKGPPLKQRPAAASSGKPAPETTSKVTPTKSKQTVTATPPPAPLAQRPEAATQAPPPPRKPRHAIQQATAPLRKPSRAVEPAYTPPLRPESSEASAFGSLGLYSQESLRRERSTPPPADDTYGHWARINQLDQGK